MDNPYYKGSAYSELQKTLQTVANSWQAIDFPSINIPTISTEFAKSLSSSMSSYNESLAQVQKVMHSLQPAFSSINKSLEMIRPTLELFQKSMHTLNFDVLSSKDFSEYLARNSAANSTENIDIVPELPKSQNNHDNKAHESSTDITGNKKFYQVQSYAVSSLQFVKTEFVTWTEGKVRNFIFTIIFYSYGRDWVWPHIKSLLEFFISYIVHHP